MSIDWFTFIAQAVNFFILLWLLKRFLYQPILNAVDAREKSIAATLLNADEKKLEAEQQFNQYRDKNQSLEQKSAALLKQAADEASRERERLIDEGRKDAEALRLKRMESLRKTADQLNINIRKQTQRQVFSIARKVLFDLASTSLEQTLVENFLGQLRDMEKSKKANLIATLNRTDHPILLRTAFELTMPWRASIEEELANFFEADIQLQFETVENLVSGIELVSNGQKLAWSISGYLDSLEKSMQELLNPHGDSGSSTEFETNQLQQQL